MVQTPKRSKVDGAEEHSDMKIDLNSSSRKCSKPMMERRRRARINDSLNQLKTLVLQATGKEESNFSKLDKADILEMTVKHIAAIQRNGLGASPPSLNHSTNFAGGFSACAKETLGLLATISDTTGTSSALQAGLFNHLATVPCSTNTGTVSPKIQNRMDSMAYQQQPQMMKGQYEIPVTNTHLTLSRDSMRTYGHYSTTALSVPQNVSTTTTSMSNAGLYPGSNFPSSVSYCQSLRSKCNYSSSGHNDLTGVAVPSSTTVKQEPDDLREYEEISREYSDSASDGSRSPNSDGSSPTSSKAWRPW